MNIKLSTEIESKRDSYEQYNPEASLVGRRCRVEPAAHAYMIERLKEWQEQEGKAGDEKPYPNTWYWDLRVHMIQKGLLSKDSSWDVCRSYLKSYAKTQKPPDEPADVD